MNRDDIIRMAREAGFEYTSANHLNLSGADWHTEECVQEYLERFAQLVAAHECEACAAMVEPIDESLADEIRARSAMGVNGDKQMTSPYEMTLEWEQVDAVVRGEIKNAIKSNTKQIEDQAQVHPEDIIVSLKLLPALFIVYEYWAGEKAVEELKKELGYEN